MALFSCSPATSSTRRSTCMRGGWGGSMGAVWANVTKGTYWSWDRGIVGFCYPTTHPPTHLVCWHLQAIPAGVPLEPREPQEVNGARPGGHALLDGGVGQPHVPELVLPCTRQFLSSQSGLRNEARLGHRCWNAFAAIGVLALQQG